MNYGYQGPPIDNFGCPSATSFGMPYPSNNSSCPPGNPGYPPNNPPYPSNPGMPCPSNNTSQNIGFDGGLPSKMPYPTPAHQPGFSSPYPSQPGAYPSQPAPYPSQPAAYPSQQGPYPSQQGPYPSQQGPYPPQQGPYPSQQGLYASQPGPYPSQPGSHPPPPKSSSTQQASYQPQLPVAPHSSGNTCGGDWSGSKVSPLNQQSTITTKLSPTVIATHGFDPRKDAEALRKAMKGFGTDEKTLIEILTKRINSQRQEIALQFKTLFGRDLINDIKSETSGNFENVLVALLTPLPQFYASELHKAMAGLGTKENVLFEIMCTASNHEMQLINDAYKTMYHKRLEDDISSDTSSHLRRLMIALSLGNRDESCHVDAAAANQDANQLLRAGELRLGTDESKFHQIFVTKNQSQLRLIFAKYQEIAGHPIEKAIDKEFSGDLKDAFLAIAKSIQDRAGFFAEQLYKSMKGCGTDDNSLIRLIVTHCETDLGEIKSKFQSKYSKSLRDWVASECSGDYKKCLLALVG